MPYLMKFAPYAVSFAVGTVGWAEQGISTGMLVGGTVLAALYLLKAAANRRGNDMTVGRYENDIDKGCIDTTRFRNRDFDD